MIARRVRAQALVVGRSAAAVAADIHDMCEPAFGTTWIRAYRLAHGIALTDVVEQVRAWFDHDGRRPPRFSETLLSAYESAQKRPGPEYLHYLCAVYRANPDDLGYPGRCLCGRSHRAPTVPGAGIPGDRAIRTARIPGPGGGSFLLPGPANGTNRTDAVNGIDRANGANGANSANGSNGANSAVGSSAGLAVNGFAAGPVAGGALTNGGRTAGGPTGSSVDSARGGYGGGFPGGYPGGYAAGSPMDAARGRRAANVDGGLATATGEAGSTGSAALAQGARAHDARGRDARGRDARGRDARGRDARGRDARGHDAGTHDAGARDAGALDAEAQGFRRQGAGVQVSGELGAGAQIPRVQSAAGGESVGPTGAGAPAALAPGALTPSPGSEAAAPTGSPAEYAPLDGTAPAGGALPDGAVPHGAPSHGAPSHGAPSHGAPSHGAPSHGAPLDGARADGFGPDGFPADGLAADGFPAGGFPAGGFPAGGAVAGGGATVQGTLPRRSAADDDDVLRRTLLEVMAGSAVSLDSGFFGAVDRVRRRMDDALLRGSVSATMIDQWEETANGYGRQYITVPPLRVLCDVLLDLGEVRRMCEERQQIEFQERLCRVAARLAALTGMIMIDLGDQRLARSFFRTARIAADETGDRSLRAWVTVRESLVPLYYGDPREAVMLAHASGDLAGRNPCVAKAMAPLVEARALARLAGPGRSSGDQARRMIARAHATFDQLGQDQRSDTAFGYTTRQLLFHEGNALAALGAAEADRVLADALARYPAIEHLDRSLISFDRATCRLSAGDVEEALHIGQQTITQLPLDYRPEIVFQRARDLGHAAAGKAGNVAAVRTYQQMIVGR